MKIYKIIYISALFGIFILIAVAAWQGLYQRPCRAANPQPLEKPEPLAEHHCPPTYESDLAQAQEYIQGLESLVSELSDEASRGSAYERAKVWREVQRSGFVFRNRVGETLAQSNQIASWMQSYSGPEDTQREALLEYLRTQVYTPEQYNAYWSLLEDKRDAARMMQAATKLAELQELLPLTEEQKQSLYAAAYITTSEHYPFEISEASFIKTLKQTISAEDLLKYEQLKNLK